MPYHVALDRANEARLGDGKVGTTGRGIGPAYADRAWRVGLRMEDLLDAELVREKLAKVAARQEPAAVVVEWARRRSTSDELVEQAAAWGERLAAAHRRHDVARPGRAPAAATTSCSRAPRGRCSTSTTARYPFVTSSNPVAGGACTGGGIGPLQVDEVIGVMKAYSTRVGSGPFPTELLDEIGKGIAERGHEVGTTTGRPRRVGWFDAVPLRYAVAVNSVSAIMLNKLDILSGVDPIRLCVAYEVDGRRVDAWPSSATVLAGATPIYEEFEGWEEPIHDVRSLADLPENARRYVSALEEQAGVPIVLAERRAGADADDRAGLAADPPAGRGGGLSDGHPRDADADPHRGRRRPRARARLEARRGAGRQRGRRRARDPTRSRASRGSVSRASTRSTRGAVVAVARQRAVELVVIGPEAPLAAGVADALDATPGSWCSGPRPPPRGSRARRRSATRSPRRPASRWPARRRSTTPAAAAAYARDEAARSGGERRRQGRRPRGRQGRRRRVERRRGRRRDRPALRRRLAPGSSSRSGSTARRRA